MTKVAIAILIALAAAGAAEAAMPFVQPADERLRQRSLPQSTDPLWTTLARSRITTDLKRGVFLADHPAEVRALDGQQVTIAGFMLSTSILPPITDFILTRYTPVCAFCPPGAPNEALQINLIRFVRRPAPGLVKVSGRLHVNADASAGLFFSLDHAEIVSGAS